MNGELEYAADLMGVAKAAQRALTILAKAAEKAEAYAVGGYHGSADADVHAVAEKLVAAVALLNDVLDS